MSHRAIQPGFCVESRIIGPAYFATAIVAGFLGAALGRQHEVGQIAGHGVVMSLFLAAPALLGGLGNGLLPGRLAGGMRLLGLNIAGFMAYVLGLSALVGTHTGLLDSAGGLVFAQAAWGTAMLMLACVLLVSILEGQPRGRVMDAFVWSQAMGAAALLVVVPVLLAALTELVLGHGDVLAGLEHAMPVPVLPVVMAPICGILAEIFGLSFIRLRGSAACFFAATGVISPGLAVIWAHGEMAHDARSAVVVVAVMALAVTGVLMQCLHAAWKRKQAFTPTVAWACGLVALLALGFAAGVRPSGHSALAFAMVFAAFAGLYHWAEIFYRSPGPMVWPHLALTFLGVSDVAIPGLVPQALAGSAMTAGLVCLVPVLLRLTVRPRAIQSPAGAHMS